MSRKTCATSNNIHQIVPVIVDILQNSEVTRLLKSGTNHSIEIYALLQKTLYDGSFVDSGIVDTSLTVKNFDSLIESSMARVSAIKEYKEEILNGIHRIVEPNGYVKCFEECAYAIVDSVHANTWIVTIISECDSDLIPSIIDYDSSTNYTIETLDASSIVNAEIHDIINIDTLTTPTVQKLTIGDDIAYRVINSIKGHELAFYMENDFELIDRLIKAIECMAQSF